MRTVRTLSPISRNIRIVQNHNCDGDVSYSAVANSPLILWHEGVEPVKAGSYIQ